MTNQVFTTPPRAFDRNGEPLAGAKAYVYQTGTMTAVTVTDMGGTPLAWPVIADLNGTFPQMFYAGTYELKLIVTDANDLIQPGYPMDPVALAQGGVSSASQITFTPTVEAPSLNVQGALEDVSEAIGDLRAVTITGTGLATGGGALTASRTIAVPIATEEEAKAGTSSTVAMTPLRTENAIAGHKFVSTDQTITSGGLLTLAHGLGEIPGMFALSVVCQTTENNWSVGDVVSVGYNNSSASNDRPTAVWADNTNVYVRFSDHANVFISANKTTGASSSLINSYWKLRVRAWS